MNEVGIVVVWYYPSDFQKENLRSLIALEKFNVCVVDNSENFDLSAQLEFENYSAIYIHNGNAGGIAGAFNVGVGELSKRKNIEVFFTMDQDSELNASFFINMFQFMNMKNAKIACPNFFDRNAKTYGTFIILTPLFYRISSCGLSHFCISSGMGITKEAWKLIGPFEKDLIIDHVDTDFCLKAYEKKVSIHVNYEECLNHAIGERKNHRFFGLTIKPNHHSYVRKYYIARNGTYLALRYFRITVGYFNLNILRLVHEMLSVLLYEKDKRRKLASLLKGIRDGVKGNLGALKK